MKNQFLNNQIKKFKILMVILIALFLNSCSKPLAQDDNDESSFEIASKLYCMIDLRGEVMHPGIYKIESGSLVNDVIELAGGFTKQADKTSINLVSTITSNMQIVVQPVGTLDHKTSTEEKQINLNTCTKEQLLVVPKIGESKAEAIIEYRKKNGGFTQLEDLLKVSGIGEALYSQIKVYFTI